MKWLVSIALLILLQFCGSTVEARPRFWLTRIMDTTAVFPTWFSSLGPPRINNANQVVLERFPYGRRAGIWQQGSITWPSFPPFVDTFTEWSDAIPYDINDSGQVIGQAFSYYHTHPYLFNGSTSELQPFDSAHWILPNGSLGCKFGIAYGLNDQGTAAGWSGWNELTDSGWSEAHERPVLWKNGQIESAGTFPGYDPDSVWYHSEKVRINNLDQIAGSALIYQSPIYGSVRAYVGSGGSLTAIPLFPFGRDSRAVDISDSGYVVGYDRMQDDSSWQHAWIWRAGNKTSIHGNINPAWKYSEPMAVNDHGEAVGCWVDYSSVGAFRALYFDGDSTYDLNSLVVNFPVGGASNNLVAATDINDRGNIVAIYRSGGINYPCLLTPYDSGLVVNSTDDDPDLDPNDGRCYTGGVNSLGWDECTLHAALQHANHSAGVDTIRFNIPPTSPGPPVIQTNLTGQGELPAIAQPVVVDGTTQPGVQRVGVNCLLQSSSTHGFRIDADSTVLRGLAVYGSQLNGVQINANGCVVEDLFVGLDPTGVTRLGNLGNGIEIAFGVGNRIGGSGASQGNRIEGNSRFGLYIQGGNSRIEGNTVVHNGFTVDSFSLPYGGIFIEGSANHVGGSSAAHANLIQDNHGTGIVVSSGDRNSVLGNSIFENSRYGIDLLPGVGPTLNDTLDSDFGPNNLQNFPVIDSVDFAQPSPELYGHLVSTPSTTFEIQLFANVECDPLDYGEGERFLISLDVTTDGQGVAQFGPIALAGLTESDYLTATATDPDGNTSEFSRCYSLPRLVILDVDENPIPQTLFQVARVASDHPLLTETFLDTATTDSLGQIFLNDVGLQSGDMVRVYTLLHTEPRTKPTTCFGAKYSVWLDNLQFSPTGFPEYYRVNDSVFQHIPMDHSTFRYNLVVSVEWDAELSYLQSMEIGLKRMANFYYDVSDGQLAFDTIVVVDDRMSWDEADIWVFASNAVWPHVMGAGGVNAYYTFLRSPVHMPRQFFGNSNQNRNLSVTRHPLDLDDADDYKTKAHELGHYLFAFYDEYRFGYFNLGSRCAPESSHRYGYMDNHYCFDPICTEMSGLPQYTDPTCQNTMQYIFNGGSCWETLESIHEQTYGGIKAPVIRPDERDSLPPGSQILEGPNASLVILDYDSGRKIHFPVAPAGPAAAQSRLFKTTYSLDGRPIPGATVISYDANSSMEQGLTSDSGLIWVLGLKPGHHILFSHSVYGAWVQGRWVGGPTISAAADDTVVVELSEVAGNLRLIQQLAVDESGVSINQTFSLPLPGAPSAIRTMALIQDGPYQFTGGDSSFMLTLPDTNGFSALFLETALDTMGDTFQFPSLLVSTSVLQSNTWNQVTTSDGRAEFVRTALTTDITRAALLATDFPVLRGNLDSIVEQAGPTVSIATAPGIVAADSAAIVIRYDDAELTASGSFGYEQTLRIFRWNTGSGQWTLVGGDVDTAHNEVFCPVTTGGTYAAFTTDVATDIGETEPVLPHGFGLNQNYPNPFNARTTIRFSIPERMQVSIDVLNLLGQRVATITRSEYAEGIHEVEWDGSDGRGRELASGLYFYRMTAGDRTISRKMLILK